jgi:hypothetical protein
MPVHVLRPKFQCQCERSQIPVGRRMAVAADGNHSRLDKILAPAPRRAKSLAARHAIRNTALRTPRHSAVAFRPANESARRLPRLRGRASERCDRELQASRPCASHCVLRPSSRRTPAHCCAHRPCVYRHRGARSHRPSSRRHDCPRSFHKGSAARTCWTVCHSWSRRQRRKQRSPQRSAPSGD